MFVNVNLCLLQLIILNGSFIYLTCYFVQRVFGVSTLEKTAHHDFRKLASAIYLQVSTISQALIFVTRSRGWSYVERPGILLVTAFVIAQLVRQLSTCSVTIFPITSRITLLIKLFFTDCHFDCGICQLELCCHRRHRLGMGWSDMVIQHNILYPT